MDTVIHVRDESIDIGDSGLGEPRVSLKSLDVMKRESEALTVSKPASIEEASSEESSSEEDDSSEESEESSSGEEDETKDFP
ncbi:hypothetical protein MMC09_000254 [Bachmanniomyces sp. S44760]|nr:hypothetical protein [Bachmanniomyces sp. S44760]